MTSTVESTTRSTRWIGQLAAAVVIIVVLALAAFGAGRVSASSHRTNLAPAKTSVPTTDPPFKCRVGRAC